MRRDQIDLDNPRFSVWECPELLMRAAAVRHPLQACNEAIRILAGDPPEANRQTNYHSIHLGPQRLFHDRADDFVGQFRAQFDFSRDSSWHYYRGGIAGLIRSYFPEDAQELGTLSITPMRRPASFRSLVDRRIEVTSLNPPRVRFLSSKLERRWEPTIRLGGFGAESFCLPVGDLDFAPATNSRGADNRWAKILVTRRVRAHTFCLRPGQEIFQETWLCRGRPDEDRPRLVQGHIPAISLDRYQGKALRVRLTPILTLGKIDLRVLSYQQLAIEIDAAAGGRILSVRHGNMPLSVLLLNSMPVEHIGMCQLLRSLVS